jgi:arylsulfatase A-like enzyme
MNRIYRVWKLVWRLTALALPVGGLAQNASTQENHILPAAPRRASILFILADDLGYGDLGCYGQTLIKTPNIDQLASQGMRFTSFYAGSPVCAPSRATLMLGNHTGHVGIRGNAELALRNDEHTVAELLQASGYRTGAIGKWGLGDAGSPGVPGNKGFEEWLGFLNQTTAHQYYPVYLDRYSWRDEKQRQIMLRDNLDGKKKTYVDDFFTDSALRFLHNNRPSQFNSHRPFFLYLPYTIPHANNELGRATGNGMEVPSDAPYGAEPWPQVEKNKAAMITRLDTYVGRLMQFLQDHHLDDDTVVVFTSDNGAHKEGGVDPAFFRSSGPLRGIKRDLCEGGIRVPFIVRWPGTVKAGTTCDLPFAFWDFLPTAAEIARLAPPKGIDGVSFLPTLRGEAQTNQHEFLYWEFHENGFHQAARMGDWKAVRHGVDGPIELYNLKTDLGEKSDVAKEHPEVVAKFESYFQRARVPDEHWPAKTAAENATKPSPGAGGAAQK